MQIKSEKSGFCKPKELYMRKHISILLSAAALLGLLSSCSITLGMDELSTTAVQTSVDSPLFEESSSEAAPEASTEEYTELTSLIFSTAAVSASHTVGAEKVGPSELEYSESTEPPTRKPGRTFPNLIQKNKYKTGKEFFDDVVFVGDSVSLGLRNYVTNQRNKGAECLGKAQFLVAGSMGYGNSLGAIGSANSIHPKYQGKEIMIEDGVQKTGAKKVFIMLGLNDFCAYSVDTGMKNAEKLIGRIIEKNPDVKIYVQSVTPVIKAKEHGRFNNQSIDAFNAALKILCNANGWTYVDVASSLKGADNCFKDEYCSDKDAQGVHMSYAGCKVWIDMLTNKYC